MQVESQSAGSKSNWKVFSDPLTVSNPVTVLILGICSSLAVTVSLKQCFVMAVSFTIVCALSNLIISFLRNTIPTRIRIIVQLVVSAVLVILVDQILRAYVYGVSKQLSVFVGLIISNTILMGRLEAFALGNKPWPSFLDGLGNGAGYGLLIMLVAFFRELFGFGTIFGFKVIPDSFYEAGYQNCGLMILPPMALITIGIIIWIQRSLNKKMIESH